MPGLAVIGAQWGDEGKGKLVDYLTARADFVVRFQGGNNAGHTLVVGNQTTKLSLIPSGVLHQGTVGLIGAGVVVDPKVLIDEMERLSKAGIVVDATRLFVDRDAHLIMPYHRLIDHAREAQLGENKIGTTGRGIGPAYEDRAKRSGVRFADLLALEQLKPRLQRNCEEANRYLKFVLESNQVVQFDSLWSELEGFASRLAPFISNVSLAVNEALDQEKKVVFEGAQGTLLDQVFGTVPFVTSSNTIAGAASTGCGIGPRRIDYVLGVAKAYSTRVGSGPFPTELPDPLGKELRDKGGEYGVVTGRPRRTGWFDAVALRKAVRLNGIDSLALTKLDVLSGFERIAICVNYKVNGKEVEDVPALAHELAQVEPQYIMLDGWKEDISSVRKWHHLPINARLYLSTVAEILGIPISIVSVGPEREQTLFSKGASFVKNFVD